MNRALTFIIALLISLSAFAQRSYTGGTFDFNSGMGQKYCYGLGFNREVSFGDAQWLYFNWHYTFGSSTHVEPYMRANASLLFYTMDDWLDVRGEKPGEIIVALILPAICPIGISAYTKPIRNSGVRVGFYCNPATLDYWEQRPASVVSVTMETGLKAIWERDNNWCWYVSAGACVTNNIADRRNQSLNYGNEYTFAAQVGFMRAKYE